MAEIGVDNDARVQLRTNHIEASAQRAQSSTSFAFRCIDAGEQGLKEVLIASQYSSKPRFTHGAFQHEERHGVVASPKLVNDRRLVTVALSEAEGQVILISVPPPHLFGAVMAVTDRLRPV